MRQRRRRRRRRRRREEEGGGGGGGRCREEEEEGGGGGGGGGGRCREGGEGREWHAYLRPLTTEILAEGACMAVVIRHEGLVVLRRLILP